MESLNEEDLKNEVVIVEKNQYLGLKYTVVSVIVILWIIILVIFNKNLIFNEHMIAGILGISLTITGILYDVSKLAKKENKEKVESELKTEIIETIGKELEMAKLIPVMLFGVAVLLGKADRAILLKTSPYLLLVVFFGTVIPFLIKFFLSGKDKQNFNIKKLIILEKLAYNSEAISIGTLVSAIVYSYLLVTQAKS